MPKLTKSFPKYRRKVKPNGPQAVVTINGKDHYLGPYGTKASKVLYDRLIAEWLASGRQVKPEADKPITVAEILARYWKHARAHYRKKDGTPTQTTERLKPALRMLRVSYGSMPAEEFGPIALKGIRMQMIEAGNSRRTVNDDVDRIRGVFRWAVSEELIEESVHRRLRTVEALQRGRSEARETDPIEPVEGGVVEATIPHLLPVVADMVRVQMLTGMRPAEVCKLRPCDVDRSRDVWEYVVGGHKTEHRGRARTVYIGPEAQAILRPYLLRGESVECFSPAEAVEQLRERRADARKTPPKYGNSRGTSRKKNPKRTAGTAYDSGSYRHAIHRACDKAFPPKTKLEGDALKKWRSDHRWSPNQLRHTTGTAIRKRFGLEAAQVILGHAAADVTQVYAERDADKARQVARLIG